MLETAFSLTLLVALWLVILWGCQVLPAEEWQMLAVVPLSKSKDGTWRGLNITWYGLILSTAMALGVLLAVLMLASIHSPLALVLVACLALVCICLPAASWVAYLVEGKAHTLTVAGGLFVGILAAPLVILGVNATLGAALGVKLEYVPMLAAAAIAYAIGEGLGRLACISFGCCYGKPVDRLPDFQRRLFSRWSFRFFGATKKIAYAGGLHEQQVVPVQGMAAMAAVTAGVVGIWLFLNSLYTPAVITVIASTQVSRFLLETLRADYRGGSGDKVSWYQLMAMATMVLTTAGSLALSSLPLPTAHIADGVRAIWTPEVLLAVAAVWLLAFVGTGRSAVTTSTLSFTVCRDRI